MSVRDLFITNCDLIVLSNYFKEFYNSPYYITTVICLLIILYLNIL